MISSAPFKTVDLESRASDLVHRLGGHWSPHGAMCHCPAHDDRTPSLSVRVGDHALLVKCWAGCDTSDVLRAIRRLDPAALVRREAPPAANPTSGRIDWVRRRAVELWDSAQPLEGTIAEAYLQRRGLSAGSPALRFHRRTPLGPRRAALHRPALIAVVRAQGRVVAVQRSFLDAQMPRLSRDLVQPRRMLGRPGAGAVPLAAAADVLGLAEGVETALAAMILLGLPVWAALGSERLALVAVPDSVRRLVLLADDDRAGRLGAARAAIAHQRPGRLIETLWPPAGRNDWNDALLLSAKR
jgi:hypothetical protein